MVVVGLMLAGAMKLLGSQLDQSRFKATRDHLQIAYDALVAFYASHAFSCPADGALQGSDANCQAAPSRRRAAPARALRRRTRCCPGARSASRTSSGSTAGTGKTTATAWSAALTSAGSASSGRPLGARHGAAGVHSTAEITPAAAFVVLSHGENGLGAWLASGEGKATAGVLAQEGENTDGAEPFVDEPLSQAVGDQFDDIVIWREKRALAQATGAVYSGPVCTAADNLWTGNGCALGAASDECVAAGARSVPAAAEDAGAGAGAPPDLITAARCSRVKVSGGLPILNHRSDPIR